jgi:hypothetical protein
MWTCALCDERSEGGGVLNHFRLMHPDIVIFPDDKVARWPDGQVVIEEDPDEFFL